MSVKHESDRHRSSKHSQLHVLSHSTSVQVVNEVADKNVLLVLEHILELNDNLSSDSAKKNESRRLTRFCNKFTNTQRTLYKLWECLGKVSNEVADIDQEIYTELWKNPRDEERLSQLYSDRADKVAKAQAFYSDRYKTYNGLLMVYFPDFVKETSKIAQELKSYGIDISGHNIQSSEILELGWRIMGKKGY